MQQIEEKGILKIYFREIIFPKEINNENYLISYKHDMSNTFINSQINGLIDIPILENDSKIEINLDIISEKSRKVLNKKIFFQEFEIKNMEDSVFSLEFIDETKNNSYFLIFDAYYSSNINNKHDKYNYFKIKINEVSGYDEFINKRKKVQKEQKLMSNNIYDYRYFIEFLYIKQIFSFELCTSEFEKLNLREYIFILSENKDEPLQINIFECEYQKYGLEDDLKLINKLKLASYNEKIVSEITILPLKNIFFSLNITLKISCHYNIFFDNYRNFISIKFLESRCENQIKNPKLLIKTYDNKQIYFLIPINNIINENQEAISIWNHQYNHLKEIQINEKNEKKNNFSDLINYKLDKHILKLKNQEISEEFAQNLFSFKNIDKLELSFKDKDLNISNYLNEIILYTNIPFDYFIIELYDDKKLIGSNIISFFEIEDNDINVTFLKNNNKNIEKIVGSFIFIANFMNKIANNNNNLYEETALLINNLNSIDYDNFNNLNYNRIYKDLPLINEIQYKSIQKNYKNIFEKENKIRTLNLQIEKVYNLRNLIDLNVFIDKTGEFNIILKNSINSYEINFNYEIFDNVTIEKNNSKIFYELKRDKKIEIFNFENQNICIYFQLNTNEIIKIYYKNEIKGYYFPIFSNLDFLSIKIMKHDKIICFYHDYLRNILINSVKEIVFIPIEINEKHNDKNIYYNKTIFFKTIFSTFENYDYNSANYISSLYYLKLIHDPQLQFEKNLENKNYELIVKSENIILYKDKLKIKNLRNTNNILQDLIEKKVIGPLNFTIEINSLYSEDDEEYQLNLMFDRDFKKYKTVFSQEFNFNTPENQFLPNTYKTFNIIINDETYSLKNKQIKFEFQFSFSFLLIHRASTIIDNPIGFIKIEFDPENLKEFIRKSNFHNNNVSFNFIVINHNKKNCIKINPFNDSKNNIILNTEKSNQIVLIQIIYENSLVQSYSINLSNLNISNINFHDYYTIYLFKIPIILKFSFTNENFNNDKITNIKDEISKKDFSEVKSENNNGKSKNNEEKKKKISDIEKIKLQIHSLKNENSNLSTQLLREQKLYKNKLMTIDEIETISNQSNSTQISQDESFLNSTKKIKLINYAEINKKKEFLYSICTCGAQNPKFKGYCENCLKKLKEDYDMKLSEYLKLHETIETLTLKNFNHEMKKNQILKKITNLKNKIENFETKTDLEKEITDDINYYNEKKKLLEIEINIIKSNNEKMVLERNEEQKELEKKLNKKNEKLLSLEKEISYFSIKIQEIELRISETNEKMINMSSKTK